MLTFLMHPANGDCIVCSSSAADFYVGASSKPKHDGRITALVQGAQM
jgi:hypothetical protein